MEILKKLQDSQNAFEDNLRLEINYEEIKDTKEGKHLLKWTRRRRRAINHICKVLKRF